VESIYRGKLSPVRGERLSRLKNLSPLTGLGFAQTETTAFSRGYILTPLRGFNPEFLEIRNI